MSFDVIDAVLQLQMREMGLQELAAGVKSTERYWEEDARLNNISQERREIIKDRVRALPAVAAAQEAAVMVGMGLEDAVEALEEQLTNGAAGANGLVGPDGRPISSNGNSAAAVVRRYPRPVPEGAESCLEGWYPAVPGIVYSIEDDMDTKEEVLKATPYRGGETVVYRITHSALFHARNREAAIMTGWKILLESAPDGMLGWPPQEKIAAWEIFVAR